MNFSDSPPAKASSRSSVRSRDSAIGSSSSDQASSSGGRPDHRFTVADYNEQRSNVRALQEALDTANAEVEELKKLLAGKDEALKQAHKANREMEARRNALDNLSETMEQDKKELQNQLTELKEQNAELKNENAAQKKQIEDFKYDIDELRDDRTDLQQRLDSLVDPVREPVMTGAGKSSSSKALTRTASRGKRDRPEPRTERSEHRSEHRTDRTDYRSDHRNDREHRSDKAERSSGSRSQKEERDKDMKERMKDRLNRDSRPPLADSRRMSRRMSVTNGSSSRPYIEEPPTSPSSNGSGHSPHYILTHPETARSTGGAYGATPRTRGSANSSGYTSPDRHEPGSYVFHPLPDQRGSR